MVLDSARHQIHSPRSYSCNWWLLRYSSPLAQTQSPFSHPKTSKPLHNHPLSKLGIWVSIHEQHSRWVCVQLTTDLELRIQSQPPLHCSRHPRPVVRIMLRTETSTTIRCPFSLSFDELLQFGYYSKLWMLTTIIRVDWIKTTPIMKFEWLSITSIYLIHRWNKNVLRQIYTHITFWVTKITSMVLIIFLSVTINYIKKRE